MEQQYVSYKIGEQYKEWAGGNIIFIETPTGSGKTTFILNKLIKYAGSKGRKILYLVNRVILKEQIQHKIWIETRYNISQNVEDIITIMTYQELENKCMKNVKEITCNDCEYYYIISDECHYFLCDSTFNTYTQISYEYIMNKRNYSALIFMSATIKEIEKLICGGKESTYNTEGDCKDTNKLHLIRNEMRVHEYIARKYDLIPDYSYIKIHILNDIKGIYDNIGKGKEKWIIFVDSVKNGEGINKYLLKSN